MELTTGEIVSLFLGIIGIAIAIGLSSYLYYLDKKRRRDEEQYYSEIIKENISRISEYYNKIEEISNNDRFDVPNEISKDLNDYYTRKQAEMKDLISYTNLYLTQWKSLKVKDKKIAQNILKKFSWIIYDYYPMHLPQETRNRKWADNKVTLSKFKEELMDESNIIRKIEV